MRSPRSLVNRIRTYIFGSNPSQALSTDNVGEDFIFVHIPKNAGSSVAKALNMETSWHHTAHSYRELLGCLAYARRFSFAFVRNPWDRFLSLYRYARLDESRYHSAINPEEAPYGKHEDYDLLQGASLEECAHYLRKGCLQHDDFINHWRPQSDWLTDEDGRVIVDFVGRVESIDEDFRTLSRHLNLAVDGLPVTNTSSSSGTSEDYRIAFTEEARKIVAQHYREDIKRWGYRF